MEGLEKAAAAARLQNFCHALQTNQRNVDSFLKKAGVEPASEEEMRVDSDNVVTHNHYYEQRNSLSPLWKLAGTALLASGFGAPLGIAAWKLPEIIEALTSKTQPVQQDIWSQYELKVGRPNPGEIE
jgi:hypothetical protein